MHWAQDAADANRILLDLARRHAVQKVVKSKSMVTEEICLNDALEGAGVKVVETDLGEYIIQLAGEPPSHIVAPAAHKRIEDIAAVMQEKLDMPPTLDAEVMCSGRGQSAPRVSQREYGRQRLQFRHCRDGDGVHRHQRGQRAHGGKPAAPMWR